MRYRHASWLFSVFELVMVATDFNQVPPVTLEQTDQFSTISFEMHIGPRVTREHVHALSGVR